MKGSSISVLIGALLLSLSIPATVVFVWYKREFQPHPYLSSQPIRNTTIDIVFSGQLENRHTETTYTGWIDRETCGSMLPGDAVCNSTVSSNLDQVYHDSLKQQGTTPDAVVVSVYNHNLSTIQAWKSRGVEVFFCVFESHTYFPNVKKFEGNATAISYRVHTAEIPYLYVPDWFLHLNQTSEVRTPVFEQPGLSNVIRGAVVIASNCWSTNEREKRSKYFIENYPPSTLAKGTSAFSFDSLGYCMKNAPWPDKVPSLDIIEAIRKYMFYFAFENSCTEDYVTEKVYNGLAAGVIPVYYGAPNVEEFVPPNSVIDASKFESLPELAAYLEKVSTNETLYRSYFQWRQNTTETAAMYERLQPYMSPYYCRMCLYAYGRTRLGYDKQWWNQKLQRWDPPPSAHSTTNATFWGRMVARLKLKEIFGTKNLTIQTSRDTSSTSTSTVLVPHDSYGLTTQAVDDTQQTSGIK